MLTCTCDWQIWLGLSVTTNQACFDRQKTFHGNKNRAACREHFIHPAFHDEPMATAPYNWNQACHLKSVTNVRFTPIKSVNVSMNEKMITIKGRETWQHYKLFYNSRFSGNYLPKLIIKKKLTSAVGTCKTKGIFYAVWQTHVRFRPFTMSNGCYL